MWQHTKHTKLGFRDVLLNTGKLVPRTKRGHMQTQLQLFRPMYDNYKKQCIKM